MQVCRLCGSTSLAEKFILNVLKRYDVPFSVCGQCRSLQSIEPYWLAESYSEAIAAYDTGALQRSVIACASVWAICVALGLRGRIIDFGGGAGVLCRLLRDTGRDAWLYDKFADPVFARPYNIRSEVLHTMNPEVVVAFEVVEHFANPAEDLEELFIGSSRVVILSTILYDENGHDWWYLTPDNGQHIFLYSKAAMQLIADRYHRTYINLGGLHLFVDRPPNPLRLAAIYLSTSRLGNRLVRVLLAGLTTSKYLQRDFDTLKDGSTARIRD